GFMKGNDLWQVVLSVAIFVAGFVLLEFLWRFSNQHTEKVLKKGGFKEWMPYVSGIFPILRLAFAALILKVAVAPLLLSEQLQTLLSGLEMFLLALALMFFVFLLVRMLDLIKLVMPTGTRRKLSTKVIKNLKGTLRIAGVVIAAGVFVYTQKALFPEWLWKSAWWDYLLIVIVFAFIYIGGRLFSVFLETMTDAMKDTEEKAHLRLVLSAAVWPIRFLLLAIAVYAAKEILTLPEGAGSVLATLVSVLGALVVVLFLYRLLDVLEYELTRFVMRDDNEFDMNFVQMVRVVARTLVVIFGVIYLLKAVTGKPMTTLLAGLGIGGLAVALAAQDTLKNLFGSFMLMIDKPFGVGDWVLVEGTHGRVEEIGFRCTRIRTFWGHLLSIPNEKMASITIENVASRPYIRRWMNVTITYDTPPDKVARSVEIIKEILKDKTELHPLYPPRVMFNDFNDTSLNILVVYWFGHNNYWKSVEFNEIVNFEILRAFEEEGIEFAFPTMTTYLAHDERRPLTIALSGGPDGKTEVPFTG
ncbi:MAG: mechanosensitive ion channel, partial [Thermodesulfobacteriota bacterium]|nr:mechanosensitive ion channel [Thermodesulfobacteriota bacterium]